MGVFPNVEVSRLEFLSLEHKSDHCSLFLVDAGKHSEKPYLEQYDNFLGAYVTGKHNLGVIRSTSCM